MGIQRLKYIWENWAPVEALKPSLSRGHLKKLTGQPETMLHAEWKLGSVANLVSHSLFRQLGRSFSFSAQRTDSRKILQGQSQKIQCQFQGRYNPLPLGNLGKPLPSLILGTVSSSQTYEKTIPDQWFSKWSPPPAASVSPENLLVTHIFKSHPSSTESEALGLSPANFFFF